MPGFPFPGRPGGEHDEPLLDMIIARRVLPPDAPPAMHDLARMLAALAGPAEPGELDGEAAVRAAFSRTLSPAGVSSTARRPVRRRRSRHSRRPAWSRVRVATVMVAAVAGLGSVFAAYIDVLPSPIQHLAHVAVAAPAPPPPAALGTGSRLRHTARPRNSQQTARPTARPHHSQVTGAVPTAGQTPTPRTGYYPRSSSSPGYRAPEPICSAYPLHSPGSVGKPSDHSRVSSCFPVTHPTTFPTQLPGQPKSTPTLYPYLP
jgi:hypothetical protein